MEALKTRLSIILLILIAFSLPVNALTAAIGNARMILNYTLESNKENVLEKSILVKNPNNITLLVNLQPEGDLDGITSFEENNITLAPETDKDVKFKVTLTEPGELTGKINVFFRDPEGNQAGIALSSNIIIFVLGEGSVMPTTNQTTKNPEKNNTANNVNKTPVTVSVGGEGNNAVTGNTIKDNNEGVNWFFIAFIVLLSVMLLAIIIFIM